MAAGIWLGHEPIASIGSPESLEAQRTKLASQLSAVLEAENRLVRDSLALRKPLPGSLSIPEIISSPAGRGGIPAAPGLPGAVDDPITDMSPWRPIPASPNSTARALDLDSSSANSSDSALARAALQFDLAYLLMPQPQVESPKTTAPKSVIEAPIERWVNINVRSGDSLSRIFKRLDLDPRIAVTIARRSDAQILNRLRTGPYLQMLVRGPELLALRYQPDLLSILSVEREGQRYRASTIKRKFDVTEKADTGVIQSSLFQSGMDNGISQDLIYNLSLIFQWQIDFSKDLSPGDQYTLIYEERSLDGRKFSSGPILAAELVVRGKTHRAIRQVSRNGASHYFTPDGESLEGLFRRSPMRVARITSPFSKRRYHPVLKKWRAHKGVDYGGSTGDPVMATADGLVTFAGRKHQYGKVITLQHGQKYSTLYAHLSRFSKNIRSGSTVTQGQLIGYVGTTGLSTGPHLHYEFRVNGIHQDPRTVKLPRSFAIDRALRPEFMKAASFWSTRLDQLARR
uniref:Membrane proteins related to metalloendopeptidases n=1 Tax=uncultured gamma proteobacterium HF0500_32L01 TaxID=723574 RepID=E7C601_9GAMM|nr:membrane proteins related to metalloendopeptidases [uncultured gamma proteobacterium HF0500_32L01]